MHTFPATEYTAFFCEENIWQLAKRLENSAPSSVLLISNAARQVPLFAQRTGRAEDGLVIWDYHVILHQAGSAGGVIFDYDSRLPFPCPLADYYHASFPQLRHLTARFHPWVRIVPASAWLRHFDSDRSHMRAADGKPLRPFPAWPLIRATDSTIRLGLMDYLDMQRSLPDASRVCRADAMLAALVSV